MSVRPTDGETLGNDDIMMARGEQELNDGMHLHVHGASKGL